MADELSDVFKQLFGPSAPGLASDIADLKGRITQLDARLDATAHELTNLGDVYNISIPSLSRHLNDVDDKTNAVIERVTRLEQAMGLPVGKPAGQQTIQAGTKLTIGNMPKPPEPRTVRIMFSGRDEHDQLYQADIHLSIERAIELAFGIIKDAVKAAGKHEPYSAADFQRQSILMGAE
ncbi:MAG TPA: hypothetical protein VLH56_19540 [Dissulfurispiraceae bacterium]|nr:hypothetical protein [Dissulfurispiraceae bacterium]